MFCSTFVQQWEICYHAVSDEIRSCYIAVCFDAVGRVSREGILPVKDGKRNMTVT